jgi:hypothetical protein
VDRLLNLLGIFFEKWETSPQSDLPELHGSQRWIFLFLQLNWIEPSRGGNNCHISTASDASQRYHKKSNGPSSFLMVLRHKGLSLFLEIRARWAAKHHFGLNVNPSLRLNGDFSLAKGRIPMSRGYLKEKW